MTGEGAWELLREYNKDEFHLEHAEIVGKTMRYFAEKLGYGDEADFWEVVGILHDLDLRCTHRSTALRVRRLCVSAA